MPVANPLYNPDWKTIHDFHAAERDRLDQEITRFYETSNYGTEFQAMKEAWDRHHAACLDSFRMQHPTIQEYAAWVFKNFDADSVLAQNFAVHIPDFESFQTLDEVSAAWAQAKENAKQAYAEKNMSLPIGRPENLDAFSSEDAGSVHRYWRYFDGDTLYPNGYGQIASINTLVTTHDKGDEFHICFMHDPNHHGLSPMNGIEQLAGVIYREASEIAQHRSRTLAARATLFERLSSMFRGAAVQLPKPEQFHFYLHIPPRYNSFIDEKFLRVKMDFEDGQFKNPQWEEMDKIPPVIQSTRFDVMRNFENSPTLRLKHQGS